MKIAIILFIGFLAVANAANEKKVVCYFTDWTVGRFPAQKIDPNLCTHILYSFVVPDGSGGVSSPRRDIVDGLNSLKRQNPNLKIMVAIGGANHSHSFSSSVKTSLQRFIENLYNLVKQYGFDGIDLDWEYPSQGDKGLFSQFVRKLKERLNPENLLLSAAVYPVRGNNGNGYDIREISKYLDFINIMAYDLRGTWASATEINAPLYAGSWEQGLNREYTVDGSIKHWMSNGAPAEKLILGVPFYGHSFTTNGQSKNVGTPKVGVGSPGPISQSGGDLFYSEICSNIKNNNWEEFFQEEQRVPYAAGGNQWVGYDNPRSINEKVNYAKQNGLGGMMVWAINQDDFAGDCGEKYPLLKAVNNIHGAGASGGRVSPIRPPRAGNNIRPAPGGNQNRPVTRPNYGNNNNNNNGARPNFAGNIWLSQNNQGYAPNNGLRPNQNNGAFNRRPAPNNGNRQGSNVCMQAGINRNPAGCSSYYLCVDNGSGLTPHRMDCPRGTLFDASIQACNYDYLVRC